MDKIKIIIVDDHSLVRDGIKSLLNDGERFEVTGEASDYVELSKLLKKNTPDIVLLDLSLPNISGIDIIKILSSDYPAIKSLAISMHKGEDYIFNALKAGAKGYLTKNITKRELHEAVAAVYEGREYFSEQISNVILNSYIKKATLPEDDKNESEEVLTKREKEILAMFAGGETNTEIADKLFISIRTVESHKNHIMLKLKLKSNVDLIKFAIKKGIIKL